MKSRRPLIQQSADSEGIFRGQEKKEYSLSLIKKGAEGLIQRKHLIPCFVEIIGIKQKGLSVRLDVWIARGFGKQGQ